VVPVGNTPPEFEGLTADALFMQSEVALYALLPDRDAMEMHMRLKIPWSFHAARCLKKDFAEIRHNLKMRGFKRVVTTAPCDGPDYTRWWKFIGFEEARIKRIYLAVGDL
jgi:hypothetical protein